MIDIADKLRFLRDPSAYPDRPSHVSVVETHMSWVFLAGAQVFKMKKPVRRRWLDFTTLAAREANCREEVRLNRRLAPDVYRGVVPLARTSRGALSLAGSGEPVEWLVQMRRLPEARMLDRMVQAGTAEPRHVEEVVDRLAAFYERLPPVSLEPGEYVTRFRQEQDHNRETLLDARLDLDRAAIRGTLGRVDALLGDAPALLHDRARRGCIVEGHGDLRPEHVCMLEAPVIIDCLEFSRTLRLVDPFDELALLSVECEVLGAGWVRDVLSARWAERAGAPPPDRLFAFYLSYRALLRARLSAAHLFEPAVRTPEKWLPLTRRYLAVAGRESLNLAPPGTR